MMGDSGKPPDLPDLPDPAKGPRIGVENMHTEDRRIGDALMLEANNDFVVRWRLCPPLLMVGKSSFNNGSFNVLHSCKTEN